MTFGIQGVFGARYGFHRGRGVQQRKLMAIIMMLIGLLAGSAIGGLGGFGGGGPQGPGGVPPFGGRRCCCPCHHRPRFGAGFPGPWIGRGAGMEMGAAFRLGPLEASMEMGFNVRGFLG